MTTATTSLDLAVALRHGLKAAGILWPGPEAHRLAGHLADQTRADDQARRRATRAERASRAKWVPTLATIVDFDDRSPPF